MLTLLAMTFRLRLHVLLLTSVALIQADDAIGQPKSINRYYSTDGHKVHYGDGSIPLPNATPETFKVLSLPFYAVDNDSVFYHATNIGPARPETFELINEQYAFDSEKAYFCGREIVSADPNSLQILDSQIGLARDAESVYFESNALEDSDAGTFRVLNQYFWKDRNNVYYLSIGGTLPQVIPHLHAPTFQLLSHDEGAHFLSTGKVQDRNGVHDVKSIVAEFEAGNPHDTK